MDLLLLSAPTWLVHILGIAFVCKSAVPLLRQNQRPGWRPSLIAWAAVAGVLYGPWAFLALHPNAGLSAMGFVLGMASLSTLPFLGTALSLNYRIPPRSVTARVVLAATIGLLGLIAFLYLSWQFLAALGFEMYP